MNFWQAVASGFSNYVKFSGRAVRSEYWYWVLFVSMVSVATVLFDVAIVKQHHGPLESVWHLVTFLPGLAVAIRRLHDIDRSGWWIALLSIFAAICFAMLLLSALRSIVLLIIMAFTVVCIFPVLMYWFCQPGTPGPNIYGADPFGPEGHISQRPAI
jgi:uncharacterized membrane protein YhaH (DUF805 family)